MGEGDKAKYLFFIPGAVFFLLVLAFYLVGYAVPYWILLVCSFLIGLILWAIARKRDTVEASETDVPEASEASWKNKFNFGKIFKILFYLALVAAALYFFIPYLMSMDTSESKGPLNSVIYVESQDGAGIVNNNGTYGIQLATGGATTGTTFIIRTKENVTGWPAFGADVYSPKEGSTLTVSYIDADNLKNSIRFQKVSIPANFSFRYSNKYKLSDYRDWIKNGTSEEVVNKGNLPRKDPIRHDIELEIYVAPNSYVELSNMVLLRNW